MLNMQLVLIEVVFLLIWLCYYPAQGFVAQCQNDRAYAVLAVLPS